jgi:hypothetical protein
MTAVLDKILENTLGGKSEEMIPKKDIESLIATRVRKELSAGQIQDVIQIFTHDMSLMCNLLWH